MSRIDSRDYVATVKNDPNLKKFMKPSQAEQLIRELTDKIDLYNDEYYQLGDSSIDDNTYDILLEQLIELEKRFPEFHRPNSPSRRVGGRPVENFSSVRHNHPMLSLSNLYSETDLSNWIDSLVSRLSGEEIVWVCELKIDGLAISLLYNEGTFEQAVTRGNGELGDEVTGNVRTIRTLPLQLKQAVSLELRGEIYLSRPRFDLINQRKEKEGMPPFKNPRNAAAGTIRIKDPKTVAQRGLDILLYDIVAGQPGNRHSENLDFIENLNLPVNPYRTRCRSLEEILSFCRRWESEKENLPFDIDGVVIKLEDLDQREIVGVTAKSPRWATAWKFKAEKAKSRLIGVENSIGRTGILTPVANLEPVELMGTVVKRATLHNYDQITRLGIHHDDTLFVEKGGEIIPKIVGVDYTQRSEHSTPLVPPEHCPICGSSLVRLEPDVDLRCENPSCPAIIEGRLEHFISKKGMDIQSLGSAVIQQLIREELVTDIPDIYTLADSKELLMELEGMGEKSVANLLQAIDASKTIPLNQFIYALGIRHIGEKAAKMLAIKTGSAERFLSLTEEELETVPDFGPIMAASLVQWLGNEKNGAVVGRLIDLGLAPTPLAIQTNQPFIGKSVVITGTLSKPRREWKRQLENAGFQVSSAVSKKTNYLLAGENAGSKLKKATQLDIPTLSEGEMEDLLAGST